MAIWIKAECSEKDGDANCSNCGHWNWSDYNYCPNCGEYMKKEVEDKGTCETCRYMHEVERKYDDKKVLIPECWGTPEPYTVSYSDTCKDFKKKV